VEKARTRTTLILLGVMMILWSARSPGQSAQVLVNGDATGPAQVSLGATAVLDLVGPPTQAFALGIGFYPAAIPTSSGTLGIDPWDPTTFIFLNGFDPSHPHHGLSFLSVVGQFTLFATPFQGGPDGFSIWTQGLVVDPTHPEGVVLTNTLEVTSVRPPPEVTQASPNYSAAGGTLYLHGSNFDSIPENNTVKIGDLPCAVLSGSAHWLLVEVPLNARSGPVSVTTSSGTGGGNPDKVHTWCAVATTPYDEGHHPALITETTTVIGLVAAPGERDFYPISANAGEEIFAEVYSWDTNSERITGSINSVNVYFDASVRIIRNNIPVAADGDSGPHQNAGIGIHNGKVNFIADETGEYVIEVDGFLGVGFGWYMVVIGTRAPLPAPLHVVSLHPNVARPGDVVHAYVAGVVGGDPTQYNLDVGGIQIPVTHAAPGRLDFVLPWDTGAISGPVNVSTASDATLHVEDEMQAWLCVITTDLRSESLQTSPLSPGDSLYGQLATSGEVDAYEFSAIAGESYFIEVSSFDDTTGRVRNVGFLFPGPLDPELRILDAETVLTGDTSGGPGLNALIGGATTPAFVAPASKTYTIQVSSLFGISWGSYIINLRPLAP